MIRVVLFLILVGLLALGAAWLADRPGDVVITWFGHRIEMSVMVLVASVIALIVIAVMLWSLLRAILNSRAIVSRFMRNRRGARGYQAISKGLIAVGSGDVASARKFATEARRMAAGEPLALLLQAQTAQLAGNRAAADEAFRAMANRPDTKLLGLHGLFIEARRRGDTTTARACVEAAAASGPTPGWAGQAALEFRSAEGDWVGALEALERNHRSGLVDKPTFRRLRAVLMTARAIAAEQFDRDRAIPLALDAVKLLPSFVPAAALAGRLLAEKGDLRKASRTIERAWREQPHPDLADAFAHLRLGDSARERLTRVQSLAATAPGHVEGAIAVARAAIDAQEFSAARAALTPHLRAPTQRVALLMAELEEQEHGDEGRVREWTARAVRAQRDPAWTADGIVSDRWLPVSPVTGRLDAFEWRVPLAQLASARPEPPAAADELEQLMAPPAPEPVGPATPAASEPDAPNDGAEAAPAAPEPAPRGRSTRNAARARAERVVEPIAPLVRVPDDPGPEPAEEPAADRRHLHNS